MSRRGEESMNRQGMHTYIDGNTVRKLELEYEREYQPSPVKVPKKKRKAKSGTAERVRGLDTFSVIFLSIAVALTGFSCVKFLEVQAEVTHLENEISQVEDQIVDMKEENKVEKANIDIDMDLDEVYKKATKELGMVHPSKKQVVLYKSTKSDTVQQYGDIPSGESKGIVESIIGE